MVKRRIMHHRLSCAELGCNERTFYEAENYNDLIRLSQTYRQGEWKCYRHSHADEVLSIERHLIVSERTSAQLRQGKYWGNMSILSGPGFKAFAEDFPAGTVLRVTAEIILPSDVDAEAGA